MRCIWLGCLSPVELTFHFFWGWTGFSIMKLHHAAPRGLRPSALTNPKAHRGGYMIQSLLSGIINLPGYSILGVGIWCNQGQSDAALKFALWIRSRLSLPFQIMSYEDKALEQQAVISLSSRQNPLRLKLTFVEKQSTKTEEPVNHIIWVSGLSWASYVSPDIPFIFKLFRREFLSLAPGKLLN